MKLDYFKIAFESVKNEWGTTDNDVVDLSQDSKAINLVIEHHPCEK